MAEKQSDLTSHKGKKKRSYTMEFKRQVVAYAVENSNRSAASHYGMGPKRVENGRKILTKSKKQKRTDNVLKEEGENALMKS